MPFKSPKVFISYSHDSPEHTDSVFALAQTLRLDGINVELDQYHSEKLHNWATWSEAQIKMADFVLCIFTKEYINRIELKVDNEVGKGVVWEWQIIQAKVYRNKGNFNIVPVLLDAADESVIPDSLYGVTCCKLQQFDLNDLTSDYAKLYRIITHKASIQAADLGEIISLPALSQRKRESDFSILGFTSLEIQNLEQPYLKRLFKDCAGLEWLDQVQQRDEDTPPLMLNAIYTALLTTDGYSALANLNLYDRLVISGDPGCGKSTLVNVLSMCLAGESLKNSESNLSVLTQPLPDSTGEQQATPQSWGHGALIPVRIILRDFASSPDFPKPKARGEAEHLTAFIQSDLKIKCCQDYWLLLQARLRCQHVLVLFDGLDEVPQADQRRNQMKQCIEAFEKSFSGNRFVVTVRPYAYSQREWQLREFRQVQLADFSEGQIKQFIKRWYHAMQHQTQDIEGRIAKLQRAVFARSDLQDLAKRPLLLTLMAFLHSNRHELPDRRADLYERLLELLIEKWEKARFKVDDANAARVIEQYSLAEYLQVGTDSIRKILERLAFAAHYYQGADDKGTADIPAEKLSHQLFLIAQESGVAVDLPKLHEYLRDRVGILYQRGGGNEQQAIYTFPHRSFQEYLSAAYIRSEERELFIDFALPNCDTWQDIAAVLIAQDTDRWREVILLAGGIKSYKEPGPVWTLLDTLAPAELLNESIEQPHAKGIFLAAEILSLQLKREKLSPRHDKINLRIPKLLTHVLGSPKIPAEQRVAYGELLAKQGEGRAEVLNVDAMQFCWIPAGEFFLGSVEGNCSLNYHYALGRYPVTVAQYKQFILDTDYEADNQSLLKPCNTPVVFVNWYDALAFCQWLEQRWSAMLPPGWQVRLPNEREWGKAVRGALQLPEDTLPPLSIQQLAQQTIVSTGFTDNPFHQRRYPWGDELSAQRANIGNAIRRTSAVGCYPAGQSPYGCEDLTGNVWEWPAAQYQGGYPGNEQIWLQHNQPDDLLRVLRGGSWNGDAGYMNSSYRISLKPKGRYGNTGFRLALCQISK